MWLAAAAITTVAAATCDLGYLLERRRLEQLGATAILDAADL